MTTVAEFVAKFGIQVDNKSIKGFNDSVKGIGTRIRGLRTALALVTAGLGVAEFARFGSELANTAQTIGVTSKELFVLRLAAKEAGQSVGEISAITTRLASVMDKVRAGFAIDPAFSTALSRISDLSGVNLSLFDENGIKSNIQILKEVFFALSQIGDEKKRISLGKIAFGVNVEPLRKQIPRASQQAEGTDFERMTGNLIALQASLADMSSAFQLFGGRLAPSAQIVIDSLTGLTRGLTKLSDFLDSIDFNPLHAGSRIVDESIKLGRAFSSITQFLGGRVKDNQRLLKAQSDIRTQPEIAQQFESFKQRTAPDPVVQNITNVQNFIDPDALLAQQLLPVLT